MLLAIPLLLTSIVLAGPAAAQSELRSRLERYQADRGSLQRSYDIPMSHLCSERMRSFYEGWTRELAAIDFERLSLEGRVDFLLFRNHLEGRLERLAFEEQRDLQVVPLVPFFETIVRLAEAHLWMEPIDPEHAATQLAGLAKQISSASSELEQKLKDGPSDFPPTLAKRAADRVAELRRTLNEWRAFYDGYDPLFTWWARHPSDEAERALSGYEGFLRDRLAGKQGADDPVIGDPIGREALLADLA
ncbi:MAG: DUF885 domain-containing protein, partial [Planctomycetota bacterium]